MQLDSRRSQSGASAVEYSLVVVAIAAILVVIVFSIGKLTGTLFADTCSSLEIGYAPATPATC